LRRRLLGSSLRTEFQTRPYIFSYLPAVIFSWLFVMKSSVRLSIEWMISRSNPACSRYRHFTHLHLRIEWMISRPNPACSRNRHFTHFTFEDRVDDIAFESGMQSQPATLRDFPDHRKSSILLLRKEWMNHACLRSLVFSRPFLDLGTESNVS